MEWNQYYTHGKIRSRLWLVLSVAFPNDAWLPRCTVTVPVKKKKPSGNLGYSLGLKFDTSTTILAAFHF